jgi:hypothetical protein
MAEAVVGTSLSLDGGWCATSIAVYLHSAFTSGTNTHVSSASHNASQLGRLRLRQSDDPDKIPDAYAS